LPATSERHPEITEVRFSRPLFITGFGRTGSTLLLNLLALDVEARAPLLWQLLAPSPRAAGDRSDPRIAAAQRRVDVFTQVDPLVQQIHPMAPEAPDECHWMMRHSPLAVTLYRVPEYWAWLKRSRSTTAVALQGYRRQVQHLQLSTAWPLAEQGVFPFCTTCRLHDVFPDANVVRLAPQSLQAIPRSAAWCRSIAG